MGQNSCIQWTTHTFNPWIGCQRVSPGCVNCYAEHTNTFVRIQRKGGRELWGPKGERHVTSEANWQKPYAWNRAAAKAGERHRVFCASLADVFEDRMELDEPRDRLFVLIEETPHLDWQLLTKRPENVLKMVPGSWAHYGFPSNIWMGTSVEDQRRAAERIPELLRIPAHVRFLSCEPLLERVVLGNLTGIHWIIVGGESGTNARPFDILWADSIIDECRRAAVAPFVKQLGACVRLPVEMWKGRNVSQMVFEPSGGMDGWRLRDSHGGDWTEWPEHLRVREFPTTVAADAA